jgi:transcriptional regulator with GAF, ATPase, and Fis domain
MSDNTNDPWIERFLDDSEDTIDTIVGYARDVLHSEHAGIMLVHHDGRVESAAVSDELVQRGDDLQYRFNEGPCLAALDESSVVMVAHARDDARWPRWGAAADEIGIRSVLSVRLARSREDPIGSLNLYNLAAGAFDTEDVELARLIARHASMALVTTGKLKAVDRALDARASVGQAIGILMVRYNIESHRAFTLLRRYSDKLDRPLLDVATTVVRARGLSPLLHNEEDGTP